MFGPGMMADDDPIDVSASVDDYVELMAEAGALVLGACRLAACLAAAVGLLLIAGLLIQKGR